VTSPSFRSSVVSAELIESLSRCGAGTGGGHALAAARMCKGMHVHGEQPLRNARQAHMQWRCALVDVFGGRVNLQWGRTSTHV
jgi:hypothetical protein